MSPMSPMSVHAAVLTHPLCCCCPCCPCCPSLQGEKDGQVYVYSTESKCAGRQSSDFSMKIGCSTDPKRRIATQQTASSEQFKVLWTSDPISYTYAYYIEQNIHKQLRMQGKSDGDGGTEWFMCTVAKVKKLFKTHLATIDTRCSKLKV